MSNEVWTRVDDYLNDLLVGSDPALDAALEASDRAGLPPIAVAPNQGKFLYLLARISSASKILEIGTLAGYSTIWLARALPPAGRLITLESVSKHAEVAEGNLRRAGVADQVEVRVGNALDTLPTLTDEAPFDFVFIDADKQNAAEYFAWSVDLARPGAVIVVDNVVRNGAVADPDTDDPAAQGIRRLNAALTKNPKVTVTAVQTVGAKGHDGFALALVG